MAAAWCPANVIKGDERFQANVEGLESHRDSATFRMERRRKGVLSRVGIHLHLTRADRQFGAAWLKREWHVAMNNLSERPKRFSSLRFLEGEGEMRLLIRQFDWAGAGLGDPSSWPPLLKTAVEIMLNCAGPAYIAWSDRFVQLYNDAYIPILGMQKHPHALGRTTDETWHEIWDLIGPMFKEVKESKTAIRAENYFLPLLRNGYLEECYFTFSYSPLVDDQGEVAGILVTAWETTAEFVTNRRGNAIRMLAQGLSEASSAEEIYAAFTKSVRHYPADLPFGLWYKMRDDRNALDLVTVSGIAGGLSLSPEVLDPNTDAFYAGYIQPDHSSFTSRPIDGCLNDWSGPGPLRPAPSQVCIKSLCYGSCPQPDDYLIVGINPMQPYEDDQKDFLQAIFMHVENAMRRVSLLERERRERDHQFQSIMAVLPCMVRMMDREQQCTFVNQTWLQFTGRSMEQELGDGWLNGVHPDDRASALESRCLPGQANEWSGEYRLRQADGNYRWVLDKVTRWCDMSGEILGSIATSVDITARKKAEQEIMSSQAALRALYDRLQSVREEERLVLAREVHDQLGQLLSAAKIDIRLLEEDIQASEDDLPRAALLVELRSARESLDQAIHTVRHIAGELRAPELGAQGLYAALFWHAEDFERRTRITCGVTVAPNLREPTGAAAIAVFRIFQEALTNILRHAQASEVEVCVMRRNSEMLLRVRDNGIGITRAQARSAHSIGLKGMRERAALLNGRILVGPVRGGGTLVALRIPFEHQSDTNE